MGTNTIQGPCWYNREERSALTKMAGLIKASLAVLLVSLTISRSEGEKEKKTYSSEECALVVRQMEKKGCKDLMSGPQETLICQKKHYRSCKNGCIEGIVPENGPCSEVSGFVYGCDKLKARWTRRNCSMREDG